MSDAATLRALLRPRRRHHYLVDALIIVLISAGVAVILLWHTIFVMIPPGSVGVLYRLFYGGTEIGFHYKEGLAVKWPWDIIYIYDLRTQARDWHATVLTFNGLTVKVQYTELYHPDADEIALLHKEYGPQYYDRLIRPLTIQAVRKIVAAYNPHQLYTADVFALSQEILALARENVGETHVHIDGIVLRELELPKALDKAITQKLQKQQLAQAYEYQIMVAEREAERKRIEAIGIRNFYSIVSDSLTPALLTWRGIEATTELANSQNSKVVIVGGGKDQLPLILGSDIHNLPPTGPQVAPVDADTEPLPDWTTLDPIFPRAREYEVIPNFSGAQPLALSPEADAAGAAGDGAIATTPPGRGMGIGTQAPR